MEGSATRWRRMARYGGGGVRFSACIQDGGGSHRGRGITLAQVRSKRRRSSAHIASGASIRLARRRPSARHILARARKRRHRFIVSRW